MKPDLQSAIDNANNLSLSQHKPMQVVQEECTGAYMVFPESKGVSIGYRRVYGTEDKQNG